MNDISRYTRDTAFARLDEELGRGGGIGREKRKNRKRSLVAYSSGRCAAAPPESRAPLLLHRGRAAGGTVAFRAGVVGVGGGHREKKKKEG